ncbi:hypothetical protein SALBM311S_04675 [Streptomyces alboniger]
MELDHGLLYCVLGSLTSEALHHQVADQQTNFLSKEHIELVLMGAGQDLVPSSGGSVEQRIRSRILPYPRCRSTIHASPTATTADRTVTAREFVVVYTVARVAADPCRIAIWAASREPPLAGPSSARSDAGTFVSSMPTSN